MRASCFLFINISMKNSLDKIYEGSVYGKPSIHLDALEPERVSSATKTSDRETVINTYLPERYHTKSKQGNNSKSTSKSLAENYKKGKGPDVEGEFISLLKGYFDTNRHLQFESVEQVMEDMYSFLKENQ